MAKKIDNNDILIMGVDEFKARIAGARSGEGRVLCEIVDCIAGSGARTVGALIEDARSRKRAEWLDFIARHGYLVARLVDESAAALPRPDARDEDVSFPAPADGEIPAFYTEGVCPGKGTLGAWAVVLPGGEARSGAFAGTTPQRMKLMAVIRAMRMSGGPATIIHHSGYIETGCGELGSRMASGWKDRKGHAVSNADLWAEFARLDRPDLAFEFTKEPGDMLWRKARDCAESALADKNPEVDRGGPKCGLTRTSAWRPA